MSILEGASRGRGRPVSSFRLVHALILIAATAVGLAFGRPFWKYVLWAGYSYPEVPDPWMYATPVTGRDPVKQWIVAMLLYGQPFLATWTFALIPIRLMPPRPRRCRLPDLPGMSAACAAVVWMLCYCVTLVEEWGSGDGPVGVRNTLMHDMLFGRWAEGVAPAILVAWSISMLGGRWKPEASWIDRLGRLLAFAWLLMAAAAHTFSIIGAV